MNLYKVVKPKNPTWNDAGQGVDNREKQEVSFKAAKKLQNEKDEDLKKVGKQANLLTKSLKEENE